MHLLGGYYILAMAFRVRDTKNHQKKFLPSWSRGLVEQADSKSTSSVHNIMWGGMKCCKDKSDIMKCGSTPVENGTPYKMGSENHKGTGFTSPKTMTFPPSSRPPSPSPPSDTAPGFWVSPFSFRLKDFPSLLQPPLSKPSPWQMMVVHEHLICVEGREHVQKSGLRRGKSQDDPDFQTRLGCLGTRCTFEYASLPAAASTQKYSPYKWGMLRNSAAWSCSIFKMNPNAHCLWDIYTPDFLTVHRCDRPCPLSFPRGCLERVARSSELELWWGGVSFLDVHQLDDFSAPPLFQSALMETNDQS